MSARKEKTGHEEMIGRQESARGRIAREGMSGRKAIAPMAIKPALNILALNEAGMNGREGMTDRKGIAREGMSGLAGKKDNQRIASGKISQNKRKTQL